MARPVFVCVLLLAMVGCVTSKRIAGHLESVDQWSYIDKFCFGAIGAQSGEIQVQINTPRVDHQLKIALYDDQTTSWSEVYHAQDSCANKLTHARSVFDVDKHKTSIPVFINEKVRPRWWYIVVADCSGEGVDLKYNIQMLNAGGFLEREFSWDTQGTVQVTCVCTVLVVVCTCLYACNLQTVGAQAPTAAKVVLMILLLESFALILSLMNLSVFAGDGVGLALCNNISRAAWLLFQVSLVVFGVAMARGWLWQSAGIGAACKMIMLISVLIVLHVCCYMWHWFVADPAEVQYIYSSPPGLLLGAVRLLCLGWLLMEVYIALQFYPIHSCGWNYYVQFGFVLGVWTASLGVYAIISRILSPWVQEKYTTSLILITDALACVLLSSLVWPEWVCAHFDDEGRVRGPQNGSKGINVPVTEHESDSLISHRQSESAINDGQESNHAFNHNAHKQSDSYHF